LLPLAVTSISSPLNLRGPSDFGSDAEHRSASPGIGSVSNRLRQPSVSEKLVGSVDIYPTILDAANIELPSGLHGRYKLIHNLRAGEATASASVDGDSAYQAAQELPPDHPARLAMERLVDPPQWELYDLREDPVEFDNLADEETMREIQQRLKAQLVQWQEETEDPFADREFRQRVMDKYSR
jgi:N-sulfoglucosamine sulfohydrolase